MKRPCPHCGKPNAEFYRAGELCNGSADQFFCQDCGTVPARMWNKFITWPDPSLQTLFYHTKEGKYYERDRTGNWYIISEEQANKLLRT